MQISDEAREQLELLGKRCQSTINFMTLNSQVSSMDMQRVIAGLAQSVQQLTQILLDDSLRDQ